jgi:hypothetical protein
MTQETTDDEFRALAAQGVARFAALSPVDQALELAEQRRSLVRGLSGKEAPRDVLADEVARLRAEVERLRAALVRLRDCDWTITPLDRMDAVRDIARAALNGEDTRPHA